MLYMILRHDFDYHNACVKIHACIVHLGTHNVYFFNVPAALRGFSEGAP